MDEVNIAVDQLEINSVINMTSEFIGYKINIEPLNRGYLVTVGCQKIAISNKETLKKEFIDYIDNPKEYIKKYNNKEVLNQN